MLTAKKLERMLASFGIRPREDGMFHHDDFVVAWEIMEENPGISDDELRKKLRERMN